MDRSAERENSKRIDYDYKVGDKVLIVKDGILRKAESRYGKEPWTITVKNHGLSRRFIQMELSGFNAEANRKELISGE